MKCSECSYAKFEKINGSPNRYYCVHKDIKNYINAGRELICRTERCSTEMKIKTSPRWCPLRKVKA